MTLGQLSQMSSFWKTASAKEKLKDKISVTFHYAPGCDQFDFVISCYTGGDSLTKEISEVWETCQIDLISIVQMADENCFKQFLKSRPPFREDRFELLKDKMQESTYPLTVQFQFTTDRKNTQEVYGGAELHLTPRSCQFSDQLFQKRKNGFELLLIKLFAL
ncbi:hypothetical protein L596_022217 [Steinernema carpocapsae]|uniref:Uncharacterized protein n=1 Tax=Steinernema carpocapsae TaxID=34508 RepID=A0A4U5ML15_STECR|nr:hypothetical protein L596_022217 [Steinernema carpocapsae]